jgi:hypothetical protein
MYVNSIDQQIHLNFSFVGDKLKGLAQRQTSLIEASIETKKLVLEQSAQIEHKATLALNAPEILKSLPSKNSSDRI